MDDGRTSIRASIHDLGGIFLDRNKFPAGKMIVFCTLCIVATPMIIFGSPTFNGRALFSFPFSDSIEHNPLEVQIRNSPGYGLFKKGMSLRAAVPIRLRSGQALATWQPPSRQEIASARENHPGFAMTCPGQVLSSFLEKAINISARWTHFAWQPGKCGQRAIGH